jgi:hypothetical protein
MGSFNDSRDWLVTLDDGSQVTVQAATEAEALDLTGDLFGGPSGVKAEPISTTPWPMRP